MAWRPTRHLLEGELDNSTLGKVVGWMRFAGMKETVRFDLQGDFHRDIRGAKIHFRGDGNENDPKAAAYMQGFAEFQTGSAGDITAGLPPYDYTRYPYLEWFGEHNGRVVIELEPEQVQVIGQPIPACESDPIPREEQDRKMAQFLAGLSQEMQVPAILVQAGTKPVSDPAFSHWVVVDGQIVGEAHSVKNSGNGQSFAIVRLFNMPEMAEYGYIDSARLQLKDSPSRN